MRRYSIPLTNLDAIFGMPWLESVSPLLMDCKELSLNFWYGNKLLLLKGIGYTPPGPFDRDRLHKEMASGREFYLLTSTGLSSKEELLKAEKSREVEKLLEEFKDVVNAPVSLPPQREFDHRIRLVDESKPVNVAPYRYAHFHKNEIEKQVEEMMNAGIMRYSTNPFASPVLLVKKKDGSWRFYTDYRALNEATIKDRFPIPTVDDILDELHGASYFSKLDLRAGYHQIRVHPDDVPKTVFRTHNGHYEYLVMAFRLCNAPSTFQAIMNHIFRPYLCKFVLVFFYDILVYSRTWHDHLGHLRKVLEVLHQHKFVIKPSKCFFGV